MKEHAKEIMKKTPFINKTELVYQILLEDILDGKLTGGMRIDQHEIAKHLEISRTPIREAMLQLCEDGFLTHNGTSNYEVYRLKMEDYILLNDFRTMLEVFACEKAVKYANGHDLKRMQEILALEKDAVTRQDRVAFAKSDLNFHQSIVLAAHNPNLEKTYDAYRAKFELYDALTLNDDIRAVAHQWHVRIFKAIDDRETSKAKELAAVHRDNTSIAAVNACMGKL